MTNREMERKLINLEAMISEIHAALIMGSKINPTEPSKDDMDRLCREILRGDKNAQSRYLKRFGDRAPARA
jgi:hypothetical protein